MRKRGHLSTPDSNILTSTIIASLCLFVGTVDSQAASSCSEVSFERLLGSRYVGSLGLESSTKTSPTLCALHCASSPHCQSANWDTIGQTCVLYDRVANSGNTPPPPVLPKRSCTLYNLSYRTRSKTRSLPVLQTVRGMTNQEDCALACYLHSVLCTGANYFPSTNQCELLSTYLEEFQQKNTAVQGGSSHSEYPQPTEHGHSEGPQDYIFDIVCDGADTDEQFLRPQIVRFLRLYPNGQTPPPPNNWGNTPPPWRPNTPPPTPPWRPNPSWLLPPRRPNPPEPTTTLSPNPPWFRPYQRRPNPPAPRPINPFETIPSVPNGGSKAQDNCGVPRITPRVSELSSGESRWIELGETRVVGGTEARPHSWPWQVSLQYFGRHICGGTLVDNQYIVTAAHCVHKDRIPGPYKVVLGSHRSLGVDQGEQTIQVAKVTVHEDYNLPRHAHDVALLKLVRPVTFTQNIRSICLAQQEAEPHTQCVSTGWGKTLGTGDANRLQQVVVPIMSFTQCNDKRYYDGQIHSSMMCAGAEGKDSCQGDSGGPLVCPAGGGRWRLQGVVSWGRGCGRAFAPGVYVKITQLRHWVISKMN